MTKGNDQGNDLAAKVAAHNQKMVEAGVPAEDSTRFDPKEVPASKEAKIRLAKPRKPVKAKAELEPEQIESRALAAAIKARKERKAQEEIEQDLASNVYYGCCSNYHPGIFFTENPKGNFTAEQFYSGYKPAGVAWPSREIPCQVCGRPVRVGGWTGRSWSIKDRFVRSMQRSEYTELIEEAAK